MRFPRLLAGVGLLSIFSLSGEASTPPSGPAADSGHVTIAPLPAAPDTSMLTGGGLNTTSAPIDKVTLGGVMRKQPRTREWVFVRGLSDAERQQLRKTREAELLRMHGSEPRSIEIAIPDSAALRKLLRFGIGDRCTPPCTLRVRVLYRELPRLQRDSLVFWGVGDRKLAPTPAGRAMPPAPHSASPRPGK